MSMLSKSPVVFFIALGCASCARSEEDIQQELDDVVAAASACADASECTLAYPGCPLGCFVAVNAAKKDDVEAKARELINSYQSGGRSCAYDCAAPGPLECVEGHCEVGASL
jgi:hypothetical protein